MARSGHGGADRGAVEEQVVEEQCVAGAEDGAHDGRIPGLGLDDVVTDGPVEVGTLGARLDESVEAPGDQVQARCVDSAAGEAEPQVEGANLFTEERPVLVPRRVGVDRDSSKLMMVG